MWVQPGSFRHFRAKGIHELNQKLLSYIHNFHMDLGAELSNCERSCCLKICSSFIVAAVLCSQAHAQQLDVMQCTNYLCSDQDVSGRWQPSSACFHMSIQPPTMRLGQDQIERVTGCSQGRSASEIVQCSPDVVWHAGLAQGAYAAPALSRAQEADGAVSRAGEPLPALSTRPFE